ncbi:hypothetical protein L226DRAFT_446336, partial [Lentinus tigrinus ALCF2SS1-7]
VWASSEQNRINFLRQNQQTIRAELYSGLQDMAVDTDAHDVDLSQLGQRIILPSSFQGGARHWYEQCQDALAICREEGSIDFFVTITCNADWPEIKAELLPGQTPSDRPDLIARVFHLKQKAIFHDIIHKNALGTVSSYIYSDEWQKRSLPHVHALFMMGQPDKLHNTTAID